MGMHVNHMLKYFWEKKIICVSVSSLCAVAFQNPPGGIRPEILQSASAGTLQLQVRVTTLLY